MCCACGIAACMDQASDNLHIAALFHCDKHDKRFFDGMCAALLFRLKQKAMAECKETAQAYAECCSGRVFSAVWACRPQLHDLNQCLHQQCALPAVLHQPVYANEVAMLHAVLVKGSRNVQHVSMLDMTVEQLSMCVVAATAARIRACKTSCSGAGARRGQPERPDWDKLLEGL